MSEGPEVGLAMLDELGADLDGYHLRHAALADLLRRAGPLRRGRRWSTSTRSRSPARLPERAYLERRLREVRGSG